MRRLDYKNVEAKFEREIFGIKFNVNIKEFENIDTKNISENEDLEKIIDKILGDGASERINKKIKSDIENGIDTNGIEEMNSKIALSILTYLTEEYIDSTMKPINKTVDKYNKYNRNVRNFKNRYRR